MHDVTLSIITICRNEPFITDTCDSVISQINQDFEWIVIDGASTDDTLMRFAQYRHRADVFISEPDTGIYNAMNKGIARARGTFLMFLNGGDALYAADTVARVMPFLKDVPECVFYGDSFRHFDAPEKCFIKTYPDIITKDFFLTGTLGHQSCFIHRNLFETYGLYCEDLRIVGDKERWLTFLAAGVDFRYLRFPCARFRMDGISRRPSPTLMAERAYLMREFFPDVSHITSAEPGDEFS